MTEIGYRGDLLVRDCQYADVTGDRYEVREVALGGFARTPRSYRNACIGVVVSNDLVGAKAVAQHRALGAPLLFEVRDKTIERWKVTESGEPEWKESIAHSQIRSAFISHAAEWEPDRIFRAKVLGEVEGVSQLDFFDVGLLPLLEGMIHKKLDKLLRNALHKIEQAYENYNHTKPNYEDLYRLVFRLIVAKVMRDRNHSIGTKANDAISILTAVENYYKVENQPILPMARQREAILDEAWKAISSAFHFQNLSVDDLAFIYESSFVTPETRKIFGTHITPPRIAEYIARKLPFEQLPESGRQVLEPCAGHGGFLVSAMRRLRELLPDNKTSTQRHKYLAQRLTAIEIERFGIEACWSRLVLADYPHPNGWQLVQADVFKGDTLARELKKAQIVFCNPPFEDFTSKERTYYNTPDLLPQKPAEMLRRIMAEPPKLLGLVLPRVFESGSSYRKFHRQLAETYDSIELVALPKVFNYSDAATMLLIGAGQRQHHAQLRVISRKVNEGVERDAFLYKGAEPAPARALYNVDDYLQPNFSLWIPPLSRIWSCLENFPKLVDIAEAHRGLMWVSSKLKEAKIRKVDTFISEKPKAGYAEGYARVQEHLEQYTLHGSPQYLSMRPEDQYDHAYEHNWASPKVVCNGARLRRTPWRIGAVVDSTGLAFSQRFLAIWPKKNISLYAIAALINSPLANAYFFSKEEDRDNRLKTLRALPILPSHYMLIGGQIDSLSRDLHKQIARAQTEKAQRTLLQVEAEILRAYDLPPSLERELLDTFQGLERPIPIEFNGYYPEGFTAYLPLNEIISKDFEDSRADRLLERLVIVDDTEISEALARRRGELIDESLPS